MNKVLPFVKILKLGDEGAAIEAVGRGVYRYLNDGKKWTVYNKLSKAKRRTFTSTLRKDLLLVQHDATVDETPGRVDEPTLRVLEQSMDALAKHYWLEQFPYPIALCYPYPLGEGGGVCQSLHPTAGLTGNWAIDFCDTPGARVLAVEAGTIQRLSGHPPGDDTADRFGTFGYNTYIRTAQGYVYFITHLGWQNPHCREGTKVVVGTVIGKVGDQHFRPDHCHYGVTSPLGIADAKKRITAVSLAPRVGA